MTSHAEAMCREWAKNYIRIPAVGGLYLLQRDLPNLVQHFVYGTKTLDYGCRGGRSTRLLKSLGLDVEGMDICNHMLEVAREEDPTVKYRLLLNPWVLPTNNNTYDFVYAGYVLPYCNTHHEMTIVIRELARVLRPAGILMFTVPDQDTYKYKWLVEETNFGVKKKLVSGCHVTMAYKNYGIISSHYYWTRMDYRKVISSSGLYLLRMHIPFGNDNDGFEWIDEKNRAVIMIYVVQKLL